MKDKIKELLRETFLLEKKKTKKDKDKKEEKEKSGDRKVDLPSDIENSFDKEEREKLKKPYITQVSAMKSMGIPNDKKGTNRGKFSKKVNAFTDPTTGYTYKFTEDEIAELRVKLDL